MYMNVHTEVSIWDKQPLLGRRFPFFSNGLLLTIFLSFSQHLIKSEVGKLFLVYSLSCHALLNHTVSCVTSKKVFDAIIFKTDKIPLNWRLMSRWCCLKFCSHHLQQWCYELFQRREFSWSQLLYLGCQEVSLDEVSGLPGHREVLWWCNWRNVLLALFQEDFSEAGCWTGISVCKKGWWQVLQENVDKVVVLCEILLCCLWFGFSLSFMTCWILVN